MWLAICKHSKHAHFKLTSCYNAYAYCLCNLQEWSDYRLKWNASDFGGLSYVIVPASEVWTPDLLLSNKWEIQNIIWDWWCQIFCYRYCCLHRVFTAGFAFKLLVTVAVSVIIFFHRSISCNNPIGQKLMQWSNYTITHYINILLSCLEMLSGTNYMQLFYRNKCKLDFLIPLCCIKEMVAIVTNKSFEYILQYLGSTPVPGSMTVV